MQARRAMANGGDRVASRGRRRAAAKRRRGCPRKRRDGGGWRSSIAEAAGGAASVVSFDSLSLSRPAWRAAPQYSDVRRAYLESPRAGTIRTRQINRPNAVCRHHPPPGWPRRHPSWSAELSRRTFALPRRRVFAPARRFAAPRQGNPISCTFFEVRCTNAPVSGRFPSPAARPYPWAIWQAMR